MKKWVFGVVIIMGILDFVFIIDFLSLVVFGEYALEMILGFDTSPVASIIVNHIPSEGISFMIAGAIVLGIIAIIEIVVLYVSFTRFGVIE